MKYLSNTVLLGALAAVLALAACGGAEPAVETEGEAAAVLEDAPPNPEAVAAAEALMSQLAERDVSLVPTMRGVVAIEYTQPVRRRSGDIVHTSIRIRNQSPNAIAGFEINEVWYDADGNVVTGAQVRYREPIMPQQVVDVALEVPRDADMERSDTEFGHADGDVRPSLVPELPDPEVEEEEEGDESTA